MPLKASTHAHQWLIFLLSPFNFTAPKEMNSPDNQCLTEVTPFTRSVHLTVDYRQALAGSCGKQA